MADNIQYRSLEYSECERIREIDASQYIGRAWREVQGSLQLINIDYLDPDFPEGFDHHLYRLQQIVKSNGIAIGAFHDTGRLIGFSALDLIPFGENCRYALLDQLFISRDYRRKGIGKKLILRTAAQAKLCGVQKLYICAGSSEETIAFYRALGCVNAVEVNQELIDDDPRDIQLEYTV